MQLYPQTAAAIRASSFRPSQAEARSPAGKQGDAGEGGEKASEVLDEQVQAHTEPCSAPSGRRDRQTSARRVRLRRGRRERRPR